jgi:hypothetical protein
MVERAGRGSTGPENDGMLGKIRPPAVDFLSPRATI